MKIILGNSAIGPEIIDRVMVDIFRCLYHMSNCVTSDSGKKQELIKTANLLFAQLETSYVWSLCGEQFKMACDNAEKDIVVDDDKYYESVGGVGSGPPSLIQISNIIGKNKT